MINSSQNVITHVPIQIRIVPLKSDRVNGEPAAGGGVVPTVDVVLQSGIGIEDFAGVAKEDGVCAGGEVAEGVVDEVSGGGSEDVADRAEVVGQGPEDDGRSCIGEEFVLLVRRPEIVVGGGSVVDLDGRLVIFGDEDGFIGADYLTDPDVVVVIGVFHDLNRGPSGGCGIVSLFCDCGQAVAVVPRV